MKNKKKLFLLFLFLLLISPYKVFAYISGPNCEYQHLDQVKLFDLHAVDEYDTFKNMVVTDKYFVILAEEKQIARGSLLKDQALLIYDIENYNLVKGPIKVEQNITDIAYNINENELYLVNETTTVQILDGTTFETKEEYTSTDKIKGISYSPTNSEYFLAVEDQIKVIADGKNESFRLQLPGEIISSNSQGLFYTYQFEEQVEDIPISSNGINFTSPDSEKCFYTDDEVGNIQVIEFDRGYNPYFLYQTIDSEGAVYVLPYDPVTTYVEIPIISDTLDVKNMTFKATVKDAEGKEYEITSENGIFNLNDLTFTKPGDYQFYVTQIKDNRDILYDSEDIFFTVKVRYITSTANYSWTPPDEVFANNGSLTIRDIVFQNKKDKFKNEKLDRSTLSCKEIEGKFYNKEGYEVTKEEYLNSCGLVENPDTGSTLPILIFTVGLGLAGTIFYFSKNKIFKV